MEKAATSPNRSLISILINSGIGARYSELRRSEASGSVVRHSILREILKVGALQVFEVHGDSPGD